MTLAIALSGLIISFGLALLRVIEFLNENKNIEVSLSWGTCQRVDLDNPWKKQILVSHWKIFWKTNDKGKILIHNFFSADPRRFILKPYSGHSLRFKEPFLLNLQRPSENSGLFMEVKIAGKRKSMIKK